ncbi:MAG: anthranilate phosphoribosyltransferase [Saprospiraceae bacterium]|nr:anthranilate phosphoribosyltransferase [Saprospiraceae bacterium]
MKAILNELYQHKKLTRAAAKRIFFDIAEQKYNDIQVASFLTVFMMRPIALEELQGFRDALLELCVKIDLEDRRTIDIVGTGGDGKDTFNISTLAAFVVAGAGYPVTKHGSYASSSASGSSDVLLHLGYEFTNQRDQLLRQLDLANICFFHAPLFHPAMKAVVPVRKQLKVKTFFNILGPLVNPAQPTYQLFGVFSLELARMYHYILQQSDKQFAIVHAMDGYDEVSLTSPFQLRMNQGEHLLSPIDLQMPFYEPFAIYGGGTIDSAGKIFLHVLQNQATAAQKDVVLANAAVAIHCIHPNQSLLDCMAEATTSLESGAAWSCFQRLLQA